MREFTLQFDVLEDKPIQWPEEPISNVLVIGHGALAARQSPTYEHWLGQNVTVHCADVVAAQLEDCLDGVHRYVLPEDERRMLAAAPFDLICINNIPRLHLITALQYGTYAKRIIIQKPQDLNYPLIQTIAQSGGPDNFRSKAVIHDHYRNKSAVAALMHELPLLLQRYGKLKRLMFFLTESKSVTDEPERAASLECGMIQDLAVHQIDIMLECLMTANEWKIREADDRLNRRVGGEIKIVNCVKLVDQTSILGDGVETCAVIDLSVTEEIEFPGGRAGAHHYQHMFDVLIVVGKGLAIEQGVVKDFKGVIIEFERPEFYAVIDLATQGVREIPSSGINRSHGGMNRPLMLISPNPPEHAIQGFGGSEFQLWQSLAFGQHVAAIAQGAKSWHRAQGMSAYPYQRPLGDLIRELASPRLDQIRNSVWSGLPPLTNFQVEELRPPLYFD